MGYWVTLYSIAVLNEEIKKVFFFVIIGLPFTFKCINW